MRRYSSGQRGQTVNLLAYAYEGSNPSRRTNTKTLKHAFRVLLYLEPGGIRKPCLVFCDVRKQNTDKVY